MIPKIIIGGPMKCVGKVREHNTSNQAVMLEFRNEGHHGFKIDKYYFERVYAGYCAMMFGE